jgi:hypothetical protein
MEKEKVLIMIKTCNKVSEHQPLINQVRVAAKTVACSSPTPMPFKTAWVARVLVMLLANAYKNKDRI